MGNRDLYQSVNIMRTFPVIISALLIGATILVFWLSPGYFNIGRTTEDTLTLLHCTGDRFAFIQGTYLHPITKEEMEAEREAVIQRVRANDGPGLSCGSTGPGDSRIIAWGYCIDYEGVPSGFNYGMGNDGPVKNAIEESNRWYQEKILNRSLERNATCTSRTVVERFRYTIWESTRIM
ncbi:MAG: hypothetical protein MIO88_01045 [Methanoregulaceae archaeon]|nr:hypothetical protein [Methanoregulaceae archaeon]